MVVRFCTADLAYLLKNHRQGSACARKAWLEKNAVADSIGKRRLFRQPGPSGLGTYKLPRRHGMNTIYLYALNVSALNPDSAVWAAFVSPGRRERMAAIRRIDDRRRSLGVELALNAALSRHMDGYAPPPAYRRLPGGKPVLETSGELFISLAHAGDWAVCALHSAAVGVDIERRERTAAVPVREWVGIESYLKLTGAGLSGGFRTLCAGETEIYRLGTRVACLARGEVGDCLVCAATDAPACLQIEAVTPPIP